MRLIDPLGYLRAHPSEWRQTLRVVIAVAVTLLAIDLLNLPQGYWAVITAVIVVQTNIGGSLKAALDRLWGTLAGAAVGALVAILLPHSSPIEVAPTTTSRCYLQRCRGGRRAHRRVPIRPLRRRPGLAS